MQNLLSLWMALDMRRRIVVIGATLAMFAAVLGLSRFAGASDTALLYAGLDEAAAGEVVQALEQRGVAYQVRGSAIHVAAAQRDELRMTLATEGLPAAGTKGYELLDGLSGFGTTAQMFDAAYLRAKEGELARTILASPQVRAARVHIAQPQGQPFLRDARPSASVTVTTATGSLPEVQARALKHLVAAAVAGLRPEDVAVIDSVGGLMAAADEADLPAAGQDRAAELRRNVERLLAARVGPGKAVVEVSVDLETAREEIVERSFDPQGRVAISQETQEKTETSRDGGDDVTVASNLPEGDAAAGGGGQSQASESRETVNFEVSETQREVLRAPGALRRVSVAVLVDGISTPGADGTLTWQPRPEEELAVLRELVASAVGLDEARGDVLTLRSLAFEPLAVQGTLAEAGFLARLPALDLMQLLQLAVLALVVLVLGLFVVRPVLTAPARRLPEFAPPLALPGAAGATAAGPRVLTGEIDDGTDLPSFPAPRQPVEDVPEPPDPVARLRRLIAERQVESVEILRGWMDLEEERR